MRQGRASTTAQLIALSAVVLGRDSRRAALLPPGAAQASERLLSAVAPAKLRAVRTRAFRGAVEAVERIMLPGIQEHYAVRKRYIETAVRGFLATGGRRVVVLGAGLDTLAVRLAPEYPAVEFLELDHPATQRYKRRAVDPLPNLSFRPADFASPPTIPAGGPACFVAEGLTMYLRPAAVAGLLRACVTAGGPGSVVVFTFIVADERGRLRFRGSRAVGAWLKAVGEPFTWGISVADLPDFVAPLGLRVRETAGTDTLRERYVRPLGIDTALAVGEVICVCEVPQC
jgi:O-methyltransferase involved in polyketide biosynthesis